VTRQEAENTITQYLKPIFGFALKRCKNAQDAEDLSQEIAAKAFHALLAKDDIADTGKFIWTVAHNTLSNYFRDAAKMAFGISLEDIAEIVADPHSEIDALDEQEVLSRLLSEIAYLSKLQRKIVIAYYFENRKQAEIAKALGIPIGTVKWHLFESKKELKRGMDTMRKASDLKFNPIKFQNYGINGSIGSKSPEEFLRSALSQNICYCVRNAAKSIYEIADDLGVSPVYIETEVEFLEEYGFLQAEKGKYIVNFIISEPTTELLTLQDAMYKRAADLFVNDLYEELVSSGILDDPDIWCGQTGTPGADHNFLLWTLIPYIAAWSGEELLDARITFEEVATMRPDGAHNLYHASVVADNLELPDDYVYMKNWCGPMWNTHGEYMLWQVDSQWSNRHDRHHLAYSNDAKRILSLYTRELEDRLSKDEYAWLAEQGYVKIKGDYDGLFQASWQIVVIANENVRDKLLELGKTVKTRHQPEFEKLKRNFTKVALASVPKHLQKAKEFELQYLFHADGWFLLHCITNLLKSGKLHMPTQAQRKSLTTLIVKNK